MTKIKTKTPKAPKVAPKAMPEGSIRDIELSALAHQEMLRYGTAVNEDRSVSEYHDGMKPVQRRVLWAAHEGGYRSTKAVEKSAMLVGKALGEYHPHGDSACYGAIVNMVNMLYPLLDGEGNFGDFFDPKGYAAMRYTNIRLSKFSEKVFFDPFYLPVMKTVASYDSKRQEPLYLLALLPNVLFNTTFAIGYGLTAQIPRFTLKSVGRAIEFILKGGEFDEKAAAKLLEFTTQWGGRLADGQGPAVRQFFKTGAGRLRYDSVYTVDAKAKKLMFTGFAPFSNFEKRAAAVAELPQVSRVANESDTKSRDPKYAVYLKANVDAKAIPQVAKSVAALFSEAESYFNNITIRAPNEEQEDEPKVTLRSSNVPQMLTQWVKYRVSLEVKACEYQISVKDREIRRLEVMRTAVANRAAIIKALDKPLDDEQTAAFLAKLLKVTLDEAKMILDLKVRQLKALEDKKLVAELKALKATRAVYAARAKKPGDYCLQHVNELVKEFA